VTQVAKDRVENRSLILRVFLPFVFGYYIAYLFRTINAVMAAPLATELGLGADDLGLLTSVYFLTFAAAQIPIGILLDRFGPRRVQSVLLVIAAVGSTLFAVSDHFWMLLVGRALVGLGVAVTAPSAPSMTIKPFRNGTRSPGNQRTRAFNPAVMAEATPRPTNARPTRSIQK